MQNPVESRDDLTKLGIHRCTCCPLPKRKRVFAYLESR